MRVGAEMRLVGVQQGNPPLEQRLEVETLGEAGTFHFLSSRLCWCQKLASRARVGTHGWSGILSALFGAAQVYYEKVQSVQSLDRFSVRHEEQN